MRSEKKTITIFGSSKPVEGDEEYSSAYNLGIRLAKNGFNVCTGGFQGIMEAVSKGAKQNGAETIGVTIDLWGSKPNNFVTEEIRCGSLFQRIQKLVEIGDAYVILRGGTGTLLEFATVWEFSNKGLMDYKPILCHSVLWKKIISVMNDQMESEGRSTDLVKSCNSIEEIADYLKNYFQ